MIYTTDNAFEYSHCILKDYNNITAIFYNNRTEEFVASSCLTEKEFIDSIGYKSLVEHVNFLLTVNLDFNEKETNLAKDFKKRYIEYFI